jgi:hypothetical protein
MIKSGMYLTPDLMLPFLIVDTIIAEKSDVRVKDTIENILKSDCDMPVPEKLSGMPALAAALVVLPRAEPRLWTTCIKTPDKANKNGDATTVAKLINMT